MESPSKTYSDWSNVHAVVIVTKNERFSQRFVVYMTLSALWNQME